MQVHVLLFGALKDLAARESEAVKLPEHSTVEQLLHLYMSRIPQAEKFAATLAVAVNREYVSGSHVLQDGDEVALLPPVSGGAGDDGTFRNAWVRLQREAIRPEALLEQLKDGEDGAVAIFDGIVRNNSRGRRTRFLDYEAYEPMALEQMQALVREAKRRFDVREIALLHRLGRLQIGETSVWIAVAAAHRAAATDACRFVIDTLKKTVPIWKKEYFEDGAVWSDGEPFPAEIVP